MSNRPCPSFNLDTMGAGSRVGVVVSEDHNLHLFIDGEDMGPMCHNIPNSMYMYITLLHNSIPILYRDANK